MSVKTALRLLAAAPLGAAAALLVSCGSSNSSKLIPVADAGPLQSDFETVVQAAQNGGGSCQTTEAALLKTEQDFDALPSSIDAGLRNTLRQGIDNLRNRALVQCSQHAATSTTSTTTTTPKTTSTENTTSTPTTSTSTDTTSTSTTTTSTPPGPGGGTPAPDETPSEASPPGGGEAAPGESDRGGHTGGSGPGAGGGNGNGNGNGNGWGNGVGGGSEAGK